MFRILLLLFLPVYVFGQNAIRGTIYDQKNKPLEFATIKYIETGLTVYSQADGHFTIPSAGAETDSLHITVTMVGKQTQTIAVGKNAHQKELAIILKDLSLTLDEVTVAIEQKPEQSNSSIVIGRQAIEQLQAFSLTDVLNTLPGKRMSAPDLQYRQNITLRSSATDDNRQTAVNSLGVAIYIDGLRQSNDANMQSRNVGIRGLAGGAIGNRRDPELGSPQYDSPFGGLDIRSIPADNIESIEVISGVASAKYGELTDGAIILNRMAGKTDYQVNMRLNGASTNISMSKGFSLGSKAGALNLNGNFLNSLQNPEDRLKNYQRVSTGLMWTNYLAKKVKNTFSADYSFKIDDRKQDPDDGREYITYSRERRLSLSNRLSIIPGGGFVRNISLNLSYDQGYNESYQQFYNNGAPLPVASKDTTGIYEGYFIPGNFLSVDHIIGEPVNYMGALSLTGLLRTGKIEHTLGFGGAFAFSGNKGRGVLADPNLPLLNTGGFTTERPYSFDLLRDVFNAGLYLEDRFKLQIFGRSLTNTFGLRYDVQNGFGTVQPRLNSSYQISKKWSVKAAYGLATKAPGMSYRYPGPTFFDIPLLTLFNGNVNESLFLVYTKKVIPDNNNLRPSRSQQFELGAGMNGSKITSSIFAYAKLNRDGFTDEASYNRIYLPEYSYTTEPGKRPVYAPTGTQKLYARLGVNTISNNLRSDNYGIEWFVNVSKIKAIETSFGMNTALSYSYFNSQGYTVAAAADSYLQPQYQAWYGVYNGQHSRNLLVTSKLSADTHIAKLGMVVSFLLDVYWLNRLETLGSSNRPIAWIDRDGNVNPIENFDPQNTLYNYLIRSPDAGVDRLDPPFVYTNMSLRVAKEIKKKLRVSLFAYNVLNIQPRYYNTITRDATTYNNPVNVGGEIALKF